MLPIVQVLFLVLVGLASVSACAGLLTVLCRVVPLLRRQRASLYSGPERRRQCEIAERWRVAGLRR